MIAPIDAYALRRTLAGLELNGERDHLSDSVRRMVDHLEALPPSDRDAAWETMRCALGDGPELVKALATVDPNGPPPEPEAGARLAYKMTRAADITPRDVEWLWRDRIPLGMLSLLAGDPKLGKSFATLAMAANVSRGAPMPHDATIPDGPGDVVLLSAEDDASRTIVPRLKSAGANLERIHILEAVYTSNGDEALPDLRADIGRIESAVASLPRCRLVIIDPVSAYLGGLDDHRNAELRGALSPLKSLAERLDIAVVLVTHLNKSSGVNGKHRVTGSIAYVGACRANFLFTRDPDDSSGRRVLMLDNGGNLAKPPPTLAYSIQDQGDGPVVVWEDEPLPITADEVLRAAADACTPDKAEGRRECEAWLRDTLAGGPVLAKEVIDWGRNAGFTVKQLERAKEGAGVSSRRVGFSSGSKCYWHVGEWSGPPEGGDDAPE